ncbi:MAG: hypothetical protein ABJG41_04390 [Cyclobacteriaceae bacterium]
MKKHLNLITLAVLLVPSITFSQTEKGSVYLNGGSTLAFLDNSPGSPNGGYFVLSSKAGYFLGDNFLMSLGTDYTKYGAYSSLGLDVSARGYVGGLFGGIGIGILREGQVSRGTQLNFEAGYAAFLNDHIALEPVLAYTRYGGDFGGGTFIGQIGIGVYF